jgi:hypothetical protein
MVLFFLGFILAIGLLAYASTQVAELSKKTEVFAKSLEERYSRSLKDLAELESKKNTEEEKT